MAASQAAALPASPPPPATAQATRRRRAPLRLVSVLGPAMVASIAYVDPGNFATNFQGGAEAGYRLVWVVVVANAMAMLVQYLSAKLGIVTGKGIAEICGQRMAPALRWGYWLQAELVAAATDLAEVVGAAIGLRLLFGLPLPWGGVVGGVAAFGLLQARRRGYRSFEVCMGAVLGVILLAFCFEAARAWPSPQATFLGLEPRLAGQQQAFLAVGIVGATVMPHAIYLHSYLATERRPTSEPERRRMLFGEKVDVFVALGVAGAVNVLMLLVAARLFREHHGALGLGAAHALLLRQAGGLAALVFSVALFTSGLSSSAVGTYAGQVVMQSLTPWRVPPWARRAVSVVPAVALLVAGVGATRALVWSQVVLAFGVPAALVPLVWLCASRDVMGTYASRAAMTAVALAVALVIIGLDLWLVAGV